MIRSTSYKLFLSQCRIRN